MNLCLRDVIPMLIFWHILISSQCLLESSAKSPANAPNSSGLMGALGSDICGVVQGRVDHLEATVERTTSKMLQMMNRCWEAEGQYHKSEETLAALRRAVDADLVSTHMLPHMLNTCYHTCYLTHATSHMLRAQCLMPACV